MIAARAFTEAKSSEEPPGGAPASSERGAPEDRSIRSVTRRNIILVAPRLIIAYPLNRNESELLGLRRGSLQRAGQCRVVERLSPAAGLPRRRDAFVKVVKGVDIANLRRTKGGRGGEDSRAWPGVKRFHRSEREGTIRARQSWRTSGWPILWETDTRRLDIFYGRRTSGPRVYDNDSRNFPLRLFMLGHGKTRGNGGQERTASLFLCEESRWDGRGRCCCIWRTEKERKMAAGTPALSTRDLRCK